VGWSHPGGPKVEEHARDGEYVDLPYVVKGMDFSFSGIMSAAKAEYDGVPASEQSGGSSDRQSDGGTPVEDVCYSLQENVFAMLAEVSERALSLTGSDELVLGGGVAQNDRLQGMLGEMCEGRGADFFVPDDRFLRDNAGMIAVLGAKMCAAGDTIDVADSRVNPDFRPDQVPVTWRDGESVARPVREEDEIQGAEAVVTIGDDRVTKRRLPRSYRHPTLDERLRTERTRLEARLTSAARRAGVPTPVVYDVDPETATIVFERVGTSELRGALTVDRVRTVGRHLARIHDAGFVHGDPTTRNVRVDGEDANGAATGEAGRVYLIDFGLGYHTGHVEDHAMDLHVFSQSLDGTADDPGRMRDAFESGYRAVGEKRVIDQLREIEGRGRYQ
ncbi:MAG: bifunctional N(6)-L-threonylcarbamoyladenine synthase/serine/threonine protein kinase, partial [Halodesulfurarchaeum sp.]